MTFEDFFVRQKDPNNLEMPFDQLGDFVPMCWIDRSVGQEKQRPVHERNYR